MSHYKKLYDKIINNPKDVSFDEIDKLLTKVGGFICRNPKGGSSHYIYYHPDLGDFVTIPKNKIVKVVYIKKAITLFNMLKGDFE